MARDIPARTTSRLSRRGFLGGIGAGAAGAAGAIARPAGLIAQVPESRDGARPDRFSRLFEDLPPFASPACESRVRCAKWGPRTGCSTPKIP